MTWARGAVQQTRIAWTRALTLANTLGDLESELQAHYGLWLYGLRTATHDDALREANAMFDTADADGDVEAGTAAGRMIGVSHHANGDLAAARQINEASLDCYENHPSHAPFRFGLNQHFLASVLWLQGHTGQAFSIAELALKHATSLDHARTLCCVLAEGSRMVAMFYRDIPALEATARTLIETADRDGL